MKRLPPLFVALATALPASGQAWSTARPIALVVPFTMAVPADKVAQVQPT